MNLNDVTHMQQLDPQGMISHINNLPQQLLDGWQIAQTYPCLTGRTSTPY